LTAVTRQTVVSPRVIEPPSHIGEGVKSAWRRRSFRHLTITDAMVIVTSFAIARFVRFGTEPGTLPSEVLIDSYTAAASVLIVGWFGALVLSGSREPRVVGNGVEEFRRVARASVGLFGLSTSSYAGWAFYSSLPRPRRRLKPNENNQ
jgi:hypothetical protein